MAPGQRDDLPVVLLVEDNPDDALLTRIALDEAGITNPVVHVDDGGEAIAVVAAGGVALVLLDLRLPRVDGAEVLAAVEQQPVAARVPVVVMATDEDATTMLGVDRARVAAAVVPKPLTATDLLSVLAALPASTAIEHRPDHAP